MSLTPDTAARLDRFLDGLMSPQEAAAFERELATNAELASHAELQHRVDDSLARLFEYGPAQAPRELPAPEPIPFRAQPSAPAAARPFHWKKWSALGAIAAVLAVAAVYVNWPSRPFTYVAPQTMYARFEKTGWNPSFRCKTDEEFVEKVKARLGQGLLIPMNTVGVVLDGWGYGDDYQGSSVSADTMVLMAHASETPDGEKKPVLMFMDKARNARDVSVPADSGLRVFTARKGNLVLYEVTPLCKPVLIDAAITK